MPRKRIYENAHERNRACRKRRAEREGWAAKPKPARRVVLVDPAVELYRETMEKRGPILAARREKALQNVKEVIAAADAREFEARHQGRPKKANGPTPFVMPRKSPDVLIAAVSDWHGER